MRSISAMSSRSASVSGPDCIMASCKRMRVSGVFQIVADAGQHFGALLDMAFDAFAHGDEGWAARRTSVAP